MTDTNHTLAQDVDRFLSLVAMKEQHNTLLQRRRDLGDTPDLLDDVQGFIIRGQATGALLDSDHERWAAQSLLDYWANYLYRAGKEPPEANLTEFDPDLAPELSDSLCPYQGLDAFRENDSSYFFGRHRLINVMLDHLKDNHLLAVVGASGSGKSSLVLAGLLPMLKLGALPGSQHWMYYPPMVPGSNPLANLTHILCNDLVDSSKGTPQTEVFLHSSEGLLRYCTDQQKPVVITIDQFEELFTLCYDETVREAFIANLLRLIQAPDAQNRLILTMRTDFEPYIARLLDLQTIFEANTLRVTPLAATELREAIESPADLVGLKFEDGIVDALLQDVLGEPAALPLLQFTLLKLWENRARNRVTWEVYRRLGGGRLALAYSADQLYNTLIPEDQVTFRRIILRMVRPGQGLEVTSNRIRREILYQTGEAHDRVDRVLTKLVQARLVRLTEGALPGDSQVEVAHEALVRNWPRLVDWLEDEREYLRRRQRLTVAAEQWEAHSRDPGTLWYGSALEEARRYEDLNRLENEFIQDGQRAVEQAEREKEAARERELAQAMTFAEEQTRWILRLRRTIIISLVQTLLYLVVVISLIFSITGGIHSNLISFILGISGCLSVPLAIIAIIAGFRVLGSKSKRSPETQNTHKLPGLEKDSTRAKDFTRMLVVRIPEGKFLYGNAKRQVELPTFWITRTLVTNAEYARFIEATNYTPPAHWQEARLLREIAKHPVTGVSWEEALAYAAWVGGRLPTETEWEKAARGTDGRNFPWGDAFGVLICNSAKSSLKTTSPVGRYSPSGDSPFGIADMAGNVWEWTSSGTASSRIVRGGSFLDSEAYVRCDARSETNPNTRAGHIGFRIAFSSEPES